jgi:hypothetical protein
MLVADRLYGDCGVYSEGELVCIALICMSCCTQGE